MPWTFDVNSVEASGRRRAVGFRRLVISGLKDKLIKIDVKVAGHLTVMQFPCKRS
jgi:hypothetical protein